jgi:hypothetical protein
MQVCHGQNKAKTAFQLKNPQEKERTMKINKKIRGTKEVKKGEGEGGKKETQC